MSATIGSLIIATVSIALSATMTFAVTRDFTERLVIPAGVTMNGVAAAGSGMDQATSLIDTDISRAVLRPLQVTADGATFEFDPTTAVTIDREGMVASALAPRRLAPFIKRVALDQALTSNPVDVPPAFSVEPERIDTWVRTVATKVDKAAVDASVTVASGLVTVTPSATGRSLQATQAIDVISDALTARATSSSEVVAELPVTVLQPTVTEKDLGKTIVVDISERRIRLFSGATLEKAYRCAVGAPGFSTPKGVFTITQKRYLPTWNNPGSAWAADMPAYIPPGPGNPLGTRALNLDAPGIRIHGTTKVSSIGTAASHGCMRMVRRDIEDLYDRVEVGTKVYIVP